MALANIEAAFGERFSPKERAGIARASYCDFARTMLDLLWSPALTRENFRRYMRIKGIEVLENLRDRGEGAIVMCIHHGNFEWASQACALAGWSGVIVTQEFKNEQIGRVFKRCREASGQRIIGQEKSMIRMLKHVKKGGNSGMLLDLNIQPGEASTIIETFGMKLCASYLHSVLALRAGARLVPLEGRSQPDGTCDVLIHPPIEITPDATYRQVAQKCWDFFEPVIRDHPHHWLWSYKHWRYKPAGAEKDYPFYSHRNKAFDELLQRIEREEN